MTGSVEWPNDPSVIGGGNVERFNNAQFCAAAGESDTSAAGKASSPQVLPGSAVGCAMPGVTATGTLATGPATSVEHMEGDSRASWSGVGLLLVARGCAASKPGVS